MRYITLLIGVVLSTMALAQTTQPAKLTELFKPYEDRIYARIAQLPNVPTQAQLDACRTDCLAIGDEFEKSVLLQYVWYVGFVNFKRDAVRWGHVEYESSPREKAMGKYNAHGDMFIITYSKPLPANRGEICTLTGQVLKANVEVTLARDDIKNGPTDKLTIAGYPVLSVYLNDGNAIPMTAKLNP